MTKPKASLILAPRPRSFPNAEDCAAEFNIAPATWSKWVAEGKAPPAIPSGDMNLPRWCWADVVAWMTCPCDRPVILAKYEGGRVADSQERDNVASPTHLDPFVINAGKFGNVAPKGKRNG